MIKKIAVLLIAVTVGVLYWQHRQLDRDALAEELITAAYYGDLLGVKNAVEEGAQLGYTLEFDDPDRHYEQAEFSALQAAASSGNEDVINYLLDLGAPADEQNYQGWTPLFIAVRDGHFEAAKLLIFREANQNIATDTGTTPLMLAVLPEVIPSKNRAALVTYMIKRGADVNAVNELGYTPLFYAVTETKDPALVELLLENGADAAWKDAQGNTLEQAARELKLPKLAALVKTYAKKQQPEVKKTPPVAPVPQSL